MHICRKKNKINTFLITNYLLFNKKKSCESIFAITMRNQSSVPEKRLSPFKGS